ncbi:TetR family transcriptional regulator [Ornithinibacillus sp. L9]|uniref:TetR family transcriptional regulator n=1 Tax=Ornithinibacillus caprae TaxID=2678566 RepID=A0A6N8FPJ2_9BACI|nr:TetR/AcrR family transcriptional regulator [Ornithinibacillus caprae]MUK89408.1 TetR family transcriptional regulator [Ornithinibacillus caprae]
MFTDDQKLTEKQKGILAAATELFAEKGYAATSTSEIAKKAGVAEGTIFRHYKTKKELLLSVVSPVMVKVLAPIIKRDLNKVLDQEFETYQEFIRAMIENRIEFVQSNLPLIRILIQELPFHSDLKEQFIEHIGKEVLGRFRQIVKHYQAKGQIIDMHPDTIIRMTGASILSYIVPRYVLIPEANWNDEEEIDRIIHILSTGIATG